MDVKPPSLPAFVFLINYVTCRSMFFQDRWWEIIAAVSWAQPAVDLCRQLLACITWVDLAECLSAPTERDRFAFCRVRGFSKMSLISDLVGKHNLSCSPTWHRPTRTRSHANRNWGLVCWWISRFLHHCAAGKQANVNCPNFLSANGNIYLNNWMFAELTHSPLCFLLCWYSLFRICFRID